jgi:type I restriction enzyme S subunit
MPADWLNVSLEDIAQDTAPICYGIVQVGRYVANGVPVLAIKNLNLDYGTNIHRTAADIERLYARSRTLPGDVLISVKGTTGRVGIVPPHFKGNISRDLARIRPRKEISSRFLYQMLQSDGAQQRLSAATVGTTRMELSISILKQVCIAVPPTKAEQEAIAEALYDADAFIESLGRLIEKNRAVKHGAMHDLLTGKRRLPGFEVQSGGQNTAVGLIPKDWGVHSLGELAHIKTGTRNNEDKIEGADYPFFVRSATVERIDTYSHDCEAILIPGEGGVGSIFHYVHGRFNVHQRVYAITQFIPSVSGRFLYFYMKETFGVHAMQNSVKATVDSLRLPTFKNFLVATPAAIEEQIAIANVLSDMDAEIDELETKLDKARDVKQGMMQDLLTGRIRLV